MVVLGNHNIPGMKRSLFFALFFTALFGTPIFSQAAFSDNDESGVRLVVPQEIDGEKAEEKKSSGTLFGGNSHFGIAGAFNTGTGYELYRFSALLDFHLDGGKYSVNVNARGASGTFDLGTEVILWPLCFKYVRAGLGIFYGLNFFGDVSLSNTFMPGLYLGIKTSGIFSMDMYVNYLLRYSTVYSMADIGVPPVENRSLGLGFVFRFALPLGFGIDFTVSSYEPLRIVLLGSPSICLDLTYKTGAWQFGAGACARFIDLFTLSAYMYDAEFKLMVRYLF